MNHISRTIASVAVASTVLGSSLVFAADTVPAGAAVPLTTTSRVTRAEKTLLTKLIQVKKRAALTKNKIKINSTQVKAKVAKVKKTRAQTKKVRVTPKKSL
jgi:hypothetical protein